MEKALILTAHASAKLRDRQIAFGWVEDTARRPLWTEPDPRERDIERRFRPIPEFGNRILRVVCVETNTAIRVISVMFDRNARPPS